MQNKTFLLLKSRKNEDTARTMKNNFHDNKTFKTWTDDLPVRRQEIPKHTVVQIRSTVAMYQTEIE